MSLTTYSRQINNDTSSICNLSHIFSELSFRLQGLTYRSQIARQKKGTSYVCSLPQILPERSLTYRSQIVIHINKDTGSVCNLPQILPESYDEVPFTLRTKIIQLL
jgi:hypothetical protein